MGTPAQAGGHTRRHRVIQIALPTAPPGGLATSQSEDGGDILRKSRRGQKPDRGRLDDHEIIATATRDLRTPANSRRPPGTGTAL